MRSNVLGATIGWRSSSLGCFISLSLSLHVPSVLMVVQPQAVFSFKHTHTHYPYSHSINTHMAITANYPQWSRASLPQTPNSLLLGPPSSLFFTETDSEDAGLDAPYSCHLHTPYACFNTPFSIDVKNVSLVLPEGMREIFHNSPQTVLTLE